ncbi:MAG: redoxin family protein [Oscillospiraceae bacterium]|nr:redoxin family protein [Oscillospiraceae bacterium]
MKKMISVLLSVLLLVSLTAAAYADEVMSDEEFAYYCFDSMGIELTYPDELLNLQGILMPFPYGAISHKPAVYMMPVYYFAVERDLLENSSDEELSEADQAAITAAQTVAFTVVVAEDSLEDALAEAGFDESMEDAVMEFGSAGALHFYFIPMQDEDYLAAIEPAFADEYRLILRVFPELLKAAALHAPEDPEAESLGITVCFETTDLDGMPVTSEELFSDNEITMINYWGTWCPNCIDEMEELAAIHTRLREKGCGIIGILQDGDEADTLALAKQILEEKGTNYPTVLLDESMDFLEDVSSFPTSFFVDRNGTVLCYPITGAAVTEYENTVCSLLSGESGGFMGAPSVSANDKGVYRVIVVDENGEAVQGVTIQFCDDSTCNIGKTDADGIAAFDLPEGTIYTAHVLKVPDGYEKSSEEFDTLDVCSDIVIVLSAAA